MTRRLKANVGELVIVLNGEGYSTLRKMARPRHECRFLTGEFGYIVDRPKSRDEKDPLWCWYDLQVKLAFPHLDYPDNEMDDRIYYFDRDQVFVCPKGTEPNQFAMERHPTEWTADYKSIWTAPEWASLTEQIVRSLR